MTGRECVQHKFSTVGCRGALPSARCHRRKMKAVKRLRRRLVATAERTGNKRGRFHNLMRGQHFERKSLYVQDLASCGSFW